MQSITIQTRKPRTRKEMIQYLQNHFRYDTMNSWNAATSYAVRVKLRQIHFPNNEIENRAYEMLEQESAFWQVNDIMREFAERYDYKFQMGFNGRSSGYIVLYEGDIEPSEHKTICAHCRQKNFNANATKCGVCGKQTMRPFKGFTTHTYSGRGLDMGEDFESWELSDLKWRVDVVYDFDQTVKKCVDAFIYFVKTHVVNEREIQVTRKIQVAEPI